MWDGSDTKSYLKNNDGLTVETISFGPVSVLPEFQRRGIGSKLIRHSITKASIEGYKAIIIEGHPINYCKHGFKGSKDFNVSNPEGRFPFSLLVLDQVSVVDKSSTTGLQPHPFLLFSFYTSNHASLSYPLGLKIKDKNSPNQQDINEAEQFATRIGPTIMNS